MLGNWRPISITCCTSKLIEKLIKNRLVPFLKRNNILTKYQFGYRSQHSTTHAILNISDNILQNFDQKKHTASIFLDLSKGFDCVNHKILLKKLFHYGIRGVAYDFFKSYLTNRQQYTSINGVESEWLTVLCGVPYKAPSLAHCYFYCIQMVCHMHLIFPSICLRTTLVCH